MEVKDQKGQDQKGQDQRQQKPSPPAIAGLLADGAKPLADVLAAGVSPQALAAAWAAGEVEFGRRKHCVCGRAAKDPDGYGPGSALVIEAGEEWTGPKERWHRPFAELAREDAALPVCEKYQRADLPRVTVKDPATGAERTVMATTDMAAAHAIVALRVRLTDKGMERAA